MEQAGACLPGSPPVVTSSILAAAPKGIADCIATLNEGRLANAQPEQEDPRLVTVPEKKSVGTTHVHVAPAGRIARDSLKRRTPWFSRSAVGHDDADPVATNHFYLPEPKLLARPRQRPGDKRFNRPDKRNDGGDENELASLHPKVKEQKCERNGMGG
jgi:hypothetical protein